ncbi:MAG: hypothetical protein H9W81_08290 [Enterococcus sp.]|nr:hypothetical protein [Enterococcus sp.]
MSDGSTVAIEPRRYRKSQLSFRPATAADYKPVLVPLEENKRMNVWDFKTSSVFTYGGKDYFVLEQKQTNVLVKDMSASTGSPVLFRVGQMRAKDVVFREATDEEKEKFTPKRLLVGAIVELPAHLVKKYKYPEDSLFVITGVTGVTYRLVQVGGNPQGYYLKGFTANDLTPVEVTKK